MQLEIWSPSQRANSSEGIRVQSPGELTLSFPDYGLYQGCTGEKRPPLVSRQAWFMIEIMDTYVLALMRRFGSLLNRLRCDRIQYQTISTIIAIRAAGP